MEDIRDVAGLEPRTKVVIRGVPGALNILHGLSGCRHSIGDDLPVCDKRLFLQARLKNRTAPVFSSSRPPVIAPGSRDDRREHNRDRSQYENDGPHSGLHRPATSPAATTADDCEHEQGRQCREDRSAARALSAPVLPSRERASSIWSVMSQALHEDEGEKKLVHAEMNAKRPAAATAAG